MLGIHQESYAPRCVLSSLGSILVAVCIFVFLAKIVAFRPRRLESFPPPSTPLAGLSEAQLSVAGLSVARLTVAVLAGLPGKAHCGHREPCHRSRRGRVREVGQESGGLQNLFNKLYGSTECILDQYFWQRPVDSACPCMPEGPRTQWDKHMHTHTHT